LLALLSGLVVLAIIRASCRTDVSRAAAIF
jgi:hypothetical protein